MSIRAVTTITLAAAAAAAACSGDVAGPASIVTEPVWHLDVALTPADGLCTDDETDDNCGEDCGCAAPSADCEDQAPFGCWSDPRCEEFGDCCVDVDDACR